MIIQVPLFYKDGRTDSVEFRLKGEMRSAYRELPPRLNASPRREGEETIKAVINLLDEGIPIRVGPQTLFRRIEFKLSDPDVIYFGYLEE